MVFKKKKSILHTVNFHLNRHPGFSADADAGVRGRRRRTTTAAAEPPGGGVEQRGHAFPAAAGGAVAVGGGAEPQRAPGGHDLQLHALLQPPGDHPHPQPHHHGNATPPDH